MDLTERRGLGITLVLRIEDPRQGHVLAHDRRRHRLGELLTHRERKAHHPRGVLDRLFGLDSAVGDDLGDALLAILLRDVADHLTAASLVEVDIEVGHRGALGVEEALEDQTVLQRVEVGDLHDEGAHGSRARTSTRADPDAVLLGPADEVGDNEEVAWITLGDDHLGLVCRLLAHRVRDPGRVAHVQPALHLLDEPGGLVLALRAREAGHVGALALGEADVAPFGNPQRVVARLGQLPPQVTHLLGALEIELVGIELEPVRVHQGRAGLHAEQRRVGLGVSGLGVVQVVGREQRKAEVLGQAQQVLHGLALDVDAVVHDLAVEVLRTEDVPELRGRLNRLAVLTLAQPRLDLATGTARGADQALTIGLKQLAVDPRLEVVALHRGQRAHPEEVMHPLRGTRQQRHVGVCARAGDVISTAGPELDPGLVGAVSTRGEVGLDADDRLDAVLLGLGPELIGSEDVTVVRRGQGRHTHLSRGLEQLVDPGGTIEHGVLGVYVQVDEALVG